MALLFIYVNTYKAHGTADQDKANPLATVLSAAMLLRYGLGEEKAAQRIEAAVLDTLDRGFRTGDIYSGGEVRRFSTFYFPHFPLDSLLAKGFWP